MIATVSKWDIDDLDIFFLEIFIKYAKLLWQLSNIWMPVCMKNDAATLCIKPYLCWDDIGCQSQHANDYFEHYGSNRFFIDINIDHIKNIKMLTWKINKEYFFETLPNSLFFQ